MSAGAHVTEEELRLMVREAIARHVATAEPDPARAFVAAEPKAHASFMLFPLARDEAADCLIEPAVRCTHCGFCKTYGH